MIGSDLHLPPRSDQHIFVEATTESTAHFYDAHVGWQASEMPRPGGIGQALRTDLSAFVDMFVIGHPCEIPIENSIKYLPWTIRWNFSFSYSC